MKLNDTDDISGQINALIVDHISKQDNFSTEEKTNILKLVFSN
jgi:hypothetical protein